MESLIHGRRNRIFIEFHEQAILLVDAEARRVLAQSGQVLWAEVKVTAGGENQAIADALLQLIADFAHRREIKKIFIAGVRGADDVRDAIGYGGFGHGQGRFDGVRPVVKAGKDMAVKVNHKRGRDSIFACLEAPGNPYEQLVTPDVPQFFGLRRTCYITLSLSTAFLAAVFNSISKK